MPVSIEAEQALLGSIITSADAFDLISGHISVDDFYLDEHKHIYASLLKMYAQSKKIDAVTLVNALVESGLRDEAGGIQYISLISQTVPSTANVKDYAKIVKDKSTLRRVINICDEVSNDAYAENDVRTLVDSAEQKIFDISNNNQAKDFRHIRDVFQNVYRDIEVASENKGAVGGRKTGFSDLDDMLVQMGAGDLIILGARPGMGKTSFALNIATNVAKSSKKSVAIFSLEMSAEQLVTRILSSEAMVDSHSLRTGMLKPEHWDSIADVINELSGCEIFIDDTSAISTTEMKSKLRRVPNLGFVVLDYIGLMQTTSNSDNRAQQVGEISRNLKIMAKDFGVPILCCAQLNRGTESRPGVGKKPTLADLRDSGSIEQDADIVLFLYRDEYYKDISGIKGEADSVDSANIAEVIVAKNRHGSVGNVKMGWNGQFTKFMSLDTRFDNDAK
jgi:replicative DNA helicase